MADGTADGKPQLVVEVGERPDDAAEGSPIYDVTTEVEALLGAHAKSFSLGYLSAKGATGPYRLQVHLVPGD